MIEVGTFIGKSTWSMARGLDDAAVPDGQIQSCDLSNAAIVPYPGPTRLFQHPKTTSTDMLARLTGKHDFLFLDGRITDEDVGRLADLLDPMAILALDDFEGMEKGVINLIKLRNDPRFKNHFLVYPASRRTLAEYAIAGHSTVAVLLPTARIALTNQG